MFRNGLPVPPAFTITTMNCIEFHINKGLTNAFAEEIKNAISVLENKTARKFGGTDGVHRPLLLSVRSSAAMPMPGMMETILNLGINDKIIRALIAQTNNPRWALNLQMKFLQNFGTMVLNVDPAEYKSVLDMIHTRRTLPVDCLLTIDELQNVVQRFQMLAQVPDDPWEQLQLVIEAMFRSWYSPRAVQFRDINSIPNDIGTAVTVQSMVYGNMNVLSGTGVACTRNPITGNKEVYGIYLANAEVSNGSTLQR